ncbi:MAG: hypothetical protein IPI11_02985 [Haliscomenobacter sp.]|nr:hypothetical protein [Haliscomenobacter sp.]
MAQLRRAAILGNAPFRDNIQQVILGIEAIREGESLDRTIPFYSISLEYYERMVKNYENFNLYSATREYNLTQPFKVQLEQFESGEITISELGAKIHNDENLNVRCKSIG